MASPRVEQMLGEIARLSEAEQHELLSSLPTVLHGAGSTHSISPVAMRQALELRERVRHRLTQSGMLTGSILTDLDEVRDSRLADLSHDSDAQDAPH